MEGDFIKINHWLRPFSWIYGTVVGVRNVMFDTGLLKSRSFRVPVISVGNITVGGTGKTPHVEYLVELLRTKFRVAVLSRGYKRKSKGFVLATAETPMQQIGDEPFQMKQKYPDLSVAVDRNRCHGIDLLTSNTVVSDVDVILLDDAFQHRYVKPGINILLVDYHRLIIYDTLLPAGRMREPLSGKNRADIVIITKCPKDLKPMEYRVITKAMHLYPYQNLYFTTLEYASLRPLFPGEAATGQRELELKTLADMDVLLLTGIASPQQMIHDLAEVMGAGEPLTTDMIDDRRSTLDLSHPRLHPMSYSDHHQFRAKDVRRINAAFSALPEPRCVVTTEKDATRLRHIDGLSPEVRRALYVLPVHIRFMQGREDTFNENIIGYVRKNSRNSILAKAKDDHKSKDGHHTGDRPRTISFRNN